MSRRAKRYALKAKMPSSEILEGNQDVEGSYDQIKDSIPFQSEHSMEPRAIVGIFKHAFEDFLGSPDLYATIQEVKGNLYNKDYLEAFSTNEKRIAYACRWSAARALSYSSLFSSLAAIRKRLTLTNVKTRVLTVGGGASSEIVALSAVFCRHKEYAPKDESSLEIVVVDIADWSEIISSLTRCIKHRWLLQPERLETKFINQDILHLDLDSIDVSNIDIVTLLFTTNELFTEKRKESVILLHALSSKCKSGTYLLIVESAGSVSNLKVGTRIFPLQFLLDTILCGKNNDDTGSWEIIEQTESCWYRVKEEEIKFDMKLENMRFFFRLYRKK